MNRLTPEIIDFFNAQGFVVVSSIDEKGFPHTACKGIVKIDEGTLHLMDLYKSVTYNNIKHNTNVSLTAVDEHEFKGYCVKGVASLVESEKIHDEVLEFWHKKLTSRITNRLLRNILGEERVSHYAESMLPDPKYLIEVKIEEVVSLAPAALFTTEEK